MPGNPFIYYGDEIAMSFRSMASKEGGFTRTGSRTPMQWTSGDNMGFSSAPADKLYLPVDPAENAANVEPVTLLWAQATIATIATPS